MSVPVAPSPSEKPNAKTPLPNPTVQIQLGVWQYALVWWILVGVYLCVAVCLTVQVVFYLVSMSWSNAEYYAETFQLLPLSGFRVAVVLYGYVLILVIYALADVVGTSIRYRRLCIAGADKPQPRPSSTTLAVKFSLSGAYYEYIIERYATYFSVRGQGYEEGKLVRDILQIMALSIQAYNSSRFTVSFYINLTYVVLIVISCASGPVLEILHLRSLARKRLATLGVDLFIDATYMILPMVLFGPYMEAYGGSNSSLFEDSYGARAIMELRILFVASYFDMAVKLVPIVGILGTTSKIRELVQRRLNIPATTEVSTALPRDVSHQLPSDHAVSFNISDQRTRATRSRQPAQGFSQMFRIASGSISQIMLIPVKRATKASFARQVLSLLMVAWGIIASAAFSVTVRAKTECPSGCQLILHPWFVPSQCRCAVQVIDCYARRIEGRVAEIVEIFSSMEKVGLATLIVLHCRELEIPPEVHWFSDLYQFEIYNSSIVSWPVTAALSSEYCRRLGMVYLVRTNLTEVPEALLHAPLPETLKEIGIVVSGLRSLPDDLDIKWPHVHTLSLDHGQFSVFPRVLGRSKLKSLTMYNNSMVEIPEDAFETSAFNYLVFNRNPLTAFPRVVGDTRRLYELQLQFTNISSLALTWSQVLFAPTTTIYARGSPICGGDERDTETEEGVTVLCSLRHSLYANVSTLSYYPLEGKTQERRVVN